MRQHLVHNTIKLILNQNLNPEKVILIFFKLNCKVQLCDYVLDEAAPCNQEKKNEQ